MVCASRQVKCRVSERILSIGVCSVLKQQSNNLSITLKYLNFVAIIFVVSVVSINYNVSSRKTDFCNLTILGLQSAHLY